MSFPGRVKASAAPEKAFSRAGPLHERLNVVDDLCRFILHEVVHIDGYFVHPEHELSTDSKYRSLRQWDNQQLRAGYSSISHKK